MGNHDEYMQESRNIDDFNPRAAISIEITREIMKIKGNGHLEYLRNRLYTHEEKSFQAAHANVFEPHNYEYVFERYEADKNFLVMRKPLLFIGHSHQPSIWMNKDNWSSMVKLGRYHNRMGKLDDSARYIINIGSVGQPRDGDSRACYAIFDDSKNTVGIFRVDYNINATNSLIRTLEIKGKKFPERNASRLYKGR